MKHNAFAEQMASVLALLGFDEVVSALDDARATVHRYADLATPADQADFNRLAGNLGAVGFFIETLQQEADRPRSHFSWHADTAVFSADMAVPRRDELADDEDDFGLHPSAMEPGGEDENVESAARQHFERACELAARLAAAPADAEAARELVELTQQLANDADLLDYALLKSRARDAGGAAVIFAISTSFLAQRSVSAQLTQALIEDWRSSDYSFSARMMDTDQNDNIFALGDNCGGGLPGD